VTSVEEFSPPQSNHGGGFIRVLIATVVIGIAGYAITWLVPRVVGVAEYTTFALFWSFTFLVVAGLSGIQQEITRATHGRRHPAVAGEARASRFALAASGIVAVVVLASAPLWAEPLFPGLGWQMVPPLAIGAAAYTLIAVLSGTLYGVTAWTAVAWCILVDGLTRLLFIGVTLMFTHDPVALAWATALPFVVTFLVIWLGVRRSLAGRTRLDVTYRGLTWNSARTIVASISMGALVSGFPLLLGLTSPGAPEHELGMLILLSTLVRAPLIVVGMAMQSFLVVLFKERSGFWRLLLTIESLVIAAGLLVAGLGWWLGPAVFAFLFPGEPVPSGELIAVLALSSALVGALCVTAPAALSRSMHGLYTAGWVVAAVTTVLCLLAPMPLESRTILALLVGPACGLLVHVTGLCVNAVRSRGH
jgi:O-antigen/teichoic acid export membrane protein